MQRELLFLGLVASFGNLGCTRETLYNLVPVSPSAITTTLPDIDASDRTNVRAENGAKFPVDGSTEFYLDDDLSANAPTKNLSFNSLPEPRIKANDLASLCFGPSPRKCPLDDKNLHPFLVAETVKLKPDAGQIGAGIIGTILLGGVVASEVYCFEKCGTAPKVVLVVSDVLVVTVLALFLKAAANPTTLRGR